MDTQKLNPAIIPVSEQSRAMTYAALLGIELSHHFEESGTGCDALYADDADCTFDAELGTEVRFVITAEDDGYWTLTDIGRANTNGVVEEQCVMRFSTLLEAIQCIAMRKVECSQIMM